MSDQWSERDSQTFMSYGRYFVPERERQIATICALIPPAAGSWTVLELACGEGLLAEAILERFPHCRVIGLDISTEMLAGASARLARFQGRFSAHHFVLADQPWRNAYSNMQAIVSSLSVHHLDGPQKQALFVDLYRMLAPGGALVLADVVEMATPEATARAADEWDAEVERRSLALDGGRAPFEFFVRERWNMYRYPDTSGVDKPSRLYDQLRWLEAVGFANVDVHWMLAGHAIFGGRKQ